VIPRDAKSLQSSMRSAPPRSAATAWSIDSTQISSTKFFPTLKLEEKPDAENYRNIRLSACEESNGL
jgi:hypothetical protein